MQVVTFNTWGVPKQIKERTMIVVDALTSMAADIVCLQEVVSPVAKYEFYRCMGNKYHIISSDCHVLQYPWIAYIPSMVVVLLMILCPLWYSLNFLWIVTMFLLSVCTLPHVVTGVTLITMNYPMSPDDGKFDFMGNMVLVRKDKFASLKVIQATPLPLQLRGYPTDIWPVWWFQTCFLRPNFMMVRCMDIVDPVKTALIVVNVHLVVGRHNHCREEQWLYILGAIESAKTRFQCQNILICGDFNAHHDEPEIKLLKLHGYRDSLDMCDNEDLGNKSRLIQDVCTWDPKNPHNQNHGQRQRIDYIFYSSVLFEVTTVHRCFDQFPFGSDHYGVVTRFSYQ